MKLKFVKAYKTDRNALLMGNANFNQDV